MASTDDLNFTNGIYRSKESFDMAEGTSSSENNRTSPPGYMTKSKFYIVVVALLMVVVCLLAACVVLAYHLETKGELAEDGSSSAVVSNQTRRTVIPTSTTDVTVTKSTLTTSTQRETSTSHNMTTPEDSSSTISSTVDMATENVTSANTSSINSTQEMTTSSMTSTDSSSSSTTTVGVKTTTEKVSSVKSSSQSTSSVETSSSGTTKLTPTSAETTSVEPITSEVTTSNLPSTKTVAACPSGWVTTEAYCFLFSTVKKNWKRARSYCTNVGSHLVEVHSSDKHNLLKTELTNNVETLVPFWIGLNDLDVEGTFVWTYSQIELKSKSFKVWGNNQPNNKNGKEHCVMLTKNFVWADDGCFNERPYICEIER